MTKVNLKPEASEVTLSEADNFVGSWIEIEYMTIKQFWIKDQEVPAEAIKNLKDGDTVELIMKTWSHDFKGHTNILSLKDNTTHNSNPYDGDFSEECIVLERNGMNLVWNKNEA